MGKREHNHESSLEFEVHMKTAISIKKPPFCLNLPLIFVIPLLPSDAIHNLNIFKFELEMFTTFNFYNHFIFNYSLLLTLFMKLLLFRPALRLAAVVVVATSRGSVWMVALSIHLSIVLGTMRYIFAHFNDLIMLCK